MKIPQVLAQTEPGSARGVRAPLGGGAGLAPVGEALSGAADALARHAENQQRAADAKRKAFGLQEAHTAKANLHGLITEAESNLKTTEFDPDRYAETLDQVVQQSIASVRQGITTDEGRARFDAESKEVGATVRGRSTQHRNQLYVQRSGDMLENGLAERLLVAGRINVNDDDAHQENLKDAAASIGASPFLTPEKKAERLRKFEEDALRERAAREAESDPQGFLDKLGTRYARLQAKNELAAKAERQVVADRKAHTAEWETWFKRVEEEADRERQAQVTALEARALQGQLTVKELDQQRAMGVVATREEYAALYKAATTEKEAKSNPQRLLDASIRAHRDVPSISGAELDKMLVNGDLNRKDWKELKDRVTSRADHFRAEGRTIKNTNHAQGEQIISRALGITGNLDKYDDQDKQLLDIALRELTARSNAFSGQEDPVVVANEIANRMAPIRQERLKLSVPALGRTLKYQAPDAATAMKRLNEQRKTLSPEIIAQEERKIADMTRAEQSAAQGQEAGKSGSGSTLRKPGTKTETGKDN